MSVSATHDCMWCCSPAPLSLHRSAVPPTTPHYPPLPLTLLSLLHPACEFINNTVPGLGMSSRGGTISVVNSSPRFLGCTFLGSSSGIAGTVYINGANTTRPLFQDCHFEGSRTRSSGWGGVTVPEGASSGTFRRCTFQGNKAASGGAVDDGGTSTTLFEDCTFSGNSAEYGGAYYGCKVITSRGAACCVSNTAFAVLLSAWSPSTLAYSRCVTRLSHLAPCSPLHIPPQTRRHARGTPAVLFPTTPRLKVLAVRPTYPLLFTPHLCDVASRITRAWRVGPSRPATPLVAHLSTRSSNIARRQTAAVPCRPPSRRSSRFQVRASVSNRLRGRCVYSLASCVTCTVVSSDTDSNTTLSHHQARHQKAHPNTSITH